MEIDTDYTNHNRNCNQTENVLVLAPSIILHRCAFSISQVIPFFECFKKDVTDDAKEHQKGLDEKHVEPGLCIQLNSV